MYEEADVVVNRISSGPGQASSFIPSPAILLTLPSNSPEGCVKEKRSASTAIPQDTPYGTVAFHPQAHTAHTHGLLGVGRQPAKHCARTGTEGVEPLTSIRSSTHPSTHSQQRHGPSKAVQHLRKRIPLHRHPHMTLWARVFDFLR